MNLPFTSFNDVRPEVASFESYEPGLSIAEIAERYGLSRVIKMASNENPLGVSPSVREVLEKCAGQAFRYPRPISSSVDSGFISTSSRPAVSRITSQTRSKVF